MRKVFLYSLLLTAGLVVSQFMNDGGQTVIAWLTLFCLAFIGIRIGYGIEVSRSQPQKYFWDCVVGTTTTVFPWLFCALYFVYVMAPAELWRSRDMWWEATLLGRFAAPTSVGLLFSMLAAAGLSGSWIYRKARILAIFDDLEVIVLYVPLKVLLINPNAHLVVVVLVIFGLLWLVWRFVHAVNLPVRWPWVMAYSAIIVTLSESINFGFKAIDDTAPVQVEVLILAFILGCMLARSAQAGDGRDQLLESSSEKSATTVVSACFMALTGLSMPHLGLTPGAMQELPPRAWEFHGISPEALARKTQFPGWGLMTLHVLALTVLSNLGKMFPAFCYRNEARPKERLALAIGMFPRGEVGAGMLIISLSYGIAGAPLTAAVLSLALNLLCSGLFILVIKRLVAPGSDDVRN